VAGKTRNTILAERTHQVIERAVWKHEMVTWQFSELHRSHTYVAAISNLFTTRSDVAHIHLLLESAHAVWQTDAKSGKIRHHLRKRCTPSNHSWQANSS